MGRCRTKEAAMVAPKFPIPLADLQKKQREIMGGVYYRSATEGVMKPRNVFTESTPQKPEKNIQLTMQERLFKEADKIIEGARDRLGLALTLLKGPLKTLEKSKGKVAKDYKGDWDDAKDIVRCTLVVEKAKDIERVYQFVKAHFSSVRTTYLKEVASGRFDAGVGYAQSEAFKRSGLQFHSEKVIRPETNACGYSGYTVFVRSGGANANKAEMQINYPGMLYAKQLEEFKRDLGEDKARDIAAKYSIVPGGLGHTLYDVAEKKGAGHQAYAAACKAYYDYFRSDPPSFELGAKAHAELKKLKLPNVSLPPLPVAPWMAQSRQVWTQPRS
jgi:hypothetical protein